MKHIFLLSFLPVLVFGQDPAYLASYGFPICAISCIRAGTKYTNCTEYDVNCICGTGFEAALAGAKQCLGEKKPCTLDELKKADCAVNKSCGAYQNTLEPDCSKVPHVYSILPPKPSPPQTLSTGAYAGIGIACATFILFIAILLYFLRKRHKRKEEKEVEVHHEMNVTSEPMELAEVQSPVEADVWHPHPQELDVTEWYKNPHPQELDGAEWYKDKRKT